MSTTISRGMRFLSNRVKGVRKSVRRIPLRVRQLVGTQVLGADHVGRRAMGKRTFAGDHPRFTKTMSATAEGRAAFENEMLAHRLFGDLPWMPPLLERGELSFSIPHFPDDLRLDRIAPSLSAEVREEVALQAVTILLDMLVRGYAHRDFHGRNLFWVEDRLWAIDFEAIAPYPEGARPPFPLCYDVTGEGLESPHQTGRMSYSRANSQSALGRLLQVPTERALDLLRAELKHDLHDASLTFQRKKGRRHTCKSERIYGSFSLPHLEVRAEEAQRDSARRLARFGLTRESVRGKTLLDLGSNVGAMTFETQNLEPARSLGVEYDGDKVRIATNVAAFNGLNAVRFMQADIDHLTPAEVGGGADIVYCLAISEHVQDRPRLFRLLGEVTREMLCFEGNTTTDPEEVKAALLQSGYRSVELLGPSDDDCRPENNRRPLLSARK
jgi:SAM-dependent methyltransferase